ncbi:MAG: hypothetical protein HOK98_11835 [Rhodospirillaceae bacterium]|jgi:hypothetical protein|nr:hypothetical protein [Rhodospirillaceae bacterium]MBT6536862.1 hypothetical protein [Rhodospirillaceae bacterium]MBT7362043.1 hypothetical protein [Rhodospirillaceae bacterium]
MTMFRFSAIFSLLFLAACAGYVSERSHIVTVITEPPGAACTLERDGVRTRLVGGTPLTFVATRDWGDIEVECKLAGHETTTGTLHSGLEPLLLGNILAGGIVGLVRDAGTGFIHRYPSRVRIVLPPLPRSTATRN